MHSKLLWDHALAYCKGHCARPLPASRAVCMWVRERERVAQCSHSCFVRTPVQQAQAQARHVCTCEWVLRDGTLDEEPSLRCSHEQHARNVWAHTHARATTRKHTQAHARTRTHGHTHTRRSMCAPRRFTAAHALLHMWARVGCGAGARAHTHTHTHTQTHTFTHTHTHTTHARTRARAYAGCGT